MATLLRTKSTPRLLKSLILAAATCLFLALPLIAQQANQPAQPRYPLTVDRDPVPSPDPDPIPGQSVAKSGGELAESVKEGAGYAIRQRVEEVVLNVTVLDDKGNLVLDLKPEEFRVLEDGVPQKLRSFQREDLPVSFGIVVDNSGSMSKKRRSVATAVLDLIKASNPEDEAFVVNFNDRAYLDQDFTNDLGKLRDAIINLHSDGTTALYDAVVASADELAKHASRGKQVLVVVTDGDDNDSTVTLKDCIRRVQDLEGPVVYSIGLLFGDEMGKNEARNARKALELLSGETGGITYEPRALDEVDSIANEVARDIRSQYTFGYSSTKPYSQGGYRKVEVEVKSKRYKNLFVRTRPGYFPRSGNETPSGKK